MAAAQYYDVVQKMYVGYFGRPADPAGLQYWAEQLSANGGDMSVITTGFGNSAEAKTLWGSYDTQVAIDTLYQQLFNRSAEPAGLIYWTNKIASGAETLATIARALAEGAQNDDVTTLAKKVAVAARYTDAADDTTANILAYKGDAAAAAARAQLKNVTKDTDAATFDVAAIVTAVAAGSTSANTGSTFTLTTSIDTITGTSGNDTIVGDSATLGAADVINGGAGTDTFTLTVDESAGTVTETPKLSAVEVVQITDVETGSDVVNMSQASGVSEVWSYNSTENAIVTELQAAATIGMKNTLDNFNVGYTSGKLGSSSASQAIKVDSVGSSAVTPVLTLDVAGSDVITSVSVNSTGGASYLQLNAQADADVELTSITVTGDKALALTVDGTNVELTNVTTVDASGMTAGGLTLDAAASTKDLTVTGSAGNDTLSVDVATQGKVTLAAGAGDDVVRIDNGTDFASDAVLNSTDSIAGGDGTADTIRMTSGTADVLDGDADRSVITGFERLRVSDDLNGTTLDISKFGINYLQIEAATTTGAATVNGFTSGATVEYRTATSSSVAVNVGMTNATSAGTNSDALTIKLNGNIAEGAATAVEFGVDGINLLTVNTADSLNTDNDTEADDGYALALTAGKDSNVSSITVTGDRALAYSASANATGLQTVDASASTGYVRIDLTNFAGTQGVTVTGSATQFNQLTGSSLADALTGGAGNDQILGAAGNDVLSGGAGNDRIEGGAGVDTMTGGAGNDTFGISAATADTAASDVITDLDFANDKVLLDDGSTVAAVINLATAVDKTVYTTLAAAADYAATQIGASKAGTFTYDGSSYLLVERGANTAFDAGDYLVKIDGATGTLSSAAPFVASLTLTGTDGNDTLVGTAGADTLSGGAGADTLVALVGNDSLTGGAGDDTITLQTATNDVNTIVFGATAALNGADTITGFEAGTSATDGDILDFRAFVTGRLIDANGSANTGTTAVTEFSTASTGEVSISNKVVVFDNGGTALTTTTLAAEFADGTAGAGTTAAFADLNAAFKAVVIEGNSAGGAGGKIWYVDSSLDGTATGVSTADIVLVGTLSTNIDIDALVGNQFL